MSVLSLPLLLFFKNYHFFFYPLELLEWERNLGSLPSRKGIAKRGSLSLVLGVKNPGGGAGVHKADYAPVSVVTPLLTTHTPIHTQTPALARGGCFGPRGSAARALPESETLPGATSSRNRRRETRCQPRAMSDLPGQSPGPGPASSSLQPRSPPVRRYRDRLPTGGRASTGPSPGRSGLGRGIPGERPGVACETETGHQLLRHRHL